MQRSLAQWLSYIESQHVNEIDMGLSRVKSVWRAMNQDVSQSTIITVAGTNGKGTTTACTEALLLSAGCFVGTFSSPHLHQFNERIKIQSQMVRDEELCEAFDYIDKARQTTPITYFEFATLAALFVFAKHSVDFILLEVGLGGRLDATNIVDADIAVITSIGFDHQNYLGDTLNKIAFEKAGIVKPLSDIVFGIVPDAVGLENIYSTHRHITVVPQVSTIDFENQCISLQNEIDGSVAISLSYEINNPQVPLQNVLVALACVLHLTARTNKNLLKNVNKTGTEKVISQLVRLRALIDDKDGVERAVNDVKLPGRYQCVSEKPYVICDVAHNAQAAEYLCSQLSKENVDKVYFVVGMLTDKNIEASIAELLSLKGVWVCCDLPGPRGEKAQRFTNYLRQQGFEPEGFCSVEKGIEYALECAKDADMICIFGSFVTIALASDVLHTLQSKK